MCSFKKKVIIEKKGQRPNKTPEAYNFLLLIFLIST